MKRFGAAAMLLVVLLVLAPCALMAQSCSLCYTQAASSTSRFIQALRSGIIILMVPPFLMSIGITVLTYRSRHRFNETDYVGLPTEQEPD